MKKIQLISIFSLSFITLLSYHSVRDFQKYTSYLRLIKSKEILVEAIVALEQKNKHLENEIKKIKNSKNYALKVLRERYHLTEENEKIIFFSE